MKAGTSHIRTRQAVRRLSAGVLFVACTWAILSNQQQTVLAQDLAAPVQFEPAHLANENGDRPTDPATLLYDFRAGAGALPLIAPDGHHLTLAEWQAVGGEATISRTPGGTELSLDLVGLVPNGVYTAWSSYFTDTPYIIPAAEAHGAAGKNDGSESSFVADENGTATYTVTLPPGPLSIHGEAPDDAFGEYAAYQVAGSYHIDGQTNGTIPGPNSVGAFYATLTAIPEPSAIGLLLIAAGGAAAAVAFRRTMGA